jgi:hypothetical protein
MTSLRSASARTSVDGQTECISRRSLTNSAAIVTRDLGDFRPLLADALRHGQATYGLVCISRRFARNRDGLGRVVTVLDTLLNAHPAIDAAVTAGGEIWLHEPAGA